MQEQEITREQAEKLFESKFWESMAPEEIAQFQLTTERLCMPFGVFHKAVEKALGRPVFTHEFGLDRDGLIAELLKERPPATFEEVLALIPEEKRVIVAVGEER